jgi:hypothetical protein
MKRFDFAMTISNPEDYITDRFHLFIILFFSCQMELKISEANSPIIIFLCEIRQLADMARFIR